MSKIDIDKILKKASVGKVEDTKNLYEVDLTPAGYAYSLTVHAKDKDKALEVAKESIEAMTIPLPVLE